MKGQFGGLVDTCRRMYVYLMYIMPFASLALGIITL